MCHWTLALAAFKACGNLCHCKYSTFFYVRFSWRLFLYEEYSYPSPLLSGKEKVKYISINTFPFYKGIKVIRVNFTLSPKGGTEAEVALERFTGGNYVKVYPETAERSADSPIFAIFAAGKSYTTSSL